MGRENRGKLPGMQLGIGELAVDWRESVLDGKDPSRLLIIWNLTNEKRVRLMSGRRARQIGPGSKSRESRGRKRTGVLFPIREYIARGAWGGIDPGGHEEDTKKEPPSNKKVGSGNALNYKKK